MIKVYQIIKSLGRGGAETLLPETLRVHDPERFTFRYAYFLPHKGQVAEDLRELGVEVDCFSATSNLVILAKAREVARVVTEWNADLIHCHLPIAGVVGRLVGRLTGLPVIYTEHNKLEHYNPMTRWLNVTTLGMNARVLACSGDVLVSLNKHVDKPGLRMEALANGVNTDRFSLANFPRTCVRAQLKLPEDRIVIGTVCVFRPQKQLQHWVSLATSVAKQYDNLHFVMVGDGPEEAMVKDLVKEHGLEGQVTFPGRIQEVRPWLASMDIYLMTSAFEGLPIALLEAMSMELPIVTTQAGGVGEAVRENVNGHLVPVEDWEKLLEPMGRLIEHAKDRRRLGAAARKTVQDEFSVQRMVSELEAVYEEVAGVKEKT